MKLREIFILVSILILVSIAAIYPFWSSVLWSLVILGPLILIGYIDVFQTKHTIRRNFPVVGHLRYLLEKLRPEIMQYFVETDTQGRPINRLLRSLIYERAKGVTDTSPFGTQLNVNISGYEWMDHSIYAKGYRELGDFSRVVVGGKDCKKPYSASILNISAMSFGALSKNAILAMNTGAKTGNFAHNTGEGGISNYHKEPGGDLIWQIGTAYFGCRTQDGKFDPDLFQKNATIENVKMIEIKISQGAKPGHGGILPAIKNTEEIAQIRNIQPYTIVRSPSRHTAFNDAEGLLNFIQQLRDLSGGKPIGFKLCVGKKHEFIEICQAIISTGIFPDFITVDGGEGGTGAAPVEFSNSIGMPMRDGLAFVCDTLNGFDLKKDIKVIASGKIIGGFHIARAMALGADMCNSARAMMMATGCIQSLQCNVNTCPTGVATQNKSLMKGLVVEDKAKRVARYHEKTVESFMELVAAANVEELSNLNRSHINRRINMNTVLQYDEIYPYIEKGSLLQRLKN